MRWMDRACARFVVTGAITRAEARQYILTCMHNCPYTHLIHIQIHIHIQLDNNRIVRRKHLLGGHLSKVSTLQRCLKAQVGNVLLQWAKLIGIHGQPRTSIFSYSEFERLKLTYAPCILLLQNILSALLYEITRILNIRTEEQSEAQSIDGESTREAAHPTRSKHSGQ